METKRPCIRVCACRHVSAPDPPGEGCQFFPFMRGPATIQGVRDPMGLRTSTEGPEPPVARAERLLLPEYVVLPNLSQPGDRSGTIDGWTGLRTAGVRLFGRSQG